MNKPELLAPAGGPRSTAYSGTLWCGRGVFREETDTDCVPRRGISTGNRCGRTLPMRMRMESGCM